MGSLLTPAITSLIDERIGWVDEELEASLSSAGDPGQPAAPAGAAIELIHNFSLVHDDIEDSDEERRHRPTVWKNWGVPHAINVGSSMQAMVNVAALRLTRSFPDPLVVKALRT